MAEGGGENMVLVVGAGPTGLMMACELTRHGIQCRIIDKNEAPTTQSRALGIQARTLEVFEAAGVIDDILNEGHELHAANMFVHGRKMMSLSFDGLDTPYPYVISLPQAQTEQILIRHLESFGIYVERQVELVDLKEERRCVRATLLNADGEQSEIEVGWLIACDGAHSSARHSLDLKFEGSQYPELFVLADVHAETALAEDALYLFNCDDGLLGIFPYGNQHFRVIADLQVPSTDSRASDLTPLDGSPVARKEPTLQEMQNLVDVRCSEPFKMTDSQWLASFVISRRQVDRYRVGRVFLAGDAAHIHSPAGGQGMNTGIQDSYNLAWKLALVMKGASLPTLLDSYNDERHAVAQGVLKMTDIMTKVNTLRNPLAKAIRDRIAPLLASQEVVMQHMKKDLSELSINYRKSAIVAEHRVSLIHAGTSSRTRHELPEIGEWFSFDVGPAAGDRAPDAIIHDPTQGRMIRLFEVLRGTEHHLLLMAGARMAANSVRSLVEIGNFVCDHYARWIDVHLIASNEKAWAELSCASSRYTDPDLVLHHKYGAASECLYLIRPDGYVGFRSLPADHDRLQAYLDKIFVSPAR